MILPHAIIQSFADTTKNFDRIRRQEQFVSMLPLSPFKGQVVYYQNAAMAEKGVVWTLRYRAGSTSTHRWEFVGGSALDKGPEGEVVFAAVEEKALTNGPSLTVPLLGEYEVAIRILVQTEGAAIVSALASVRKNGVFLAEVDKLLLTSVFNGGYTTNSTKVNLSAADELTIGCKLEQAVKVKFQSGRVMMTPVRVG